MNRHDKRLGMNRPITRRDFLNGVSIAIGAALVPGCTRSDDPIQPPVSYYPPAETGMRGSHPGSFEVAHAAVMGNQQWSARPIDQPYDLVVVGAGISGLAAAHLYRRDIDPGARILILDNHDDFGGHAKRNEFTIDGRTLVGFGGTQMIESPRTYPAVAKQVFRDLGLDAERYSDYVHGDLFASLGMPRASFFDKETFGADFLSVGSQGYTEAFRDSPLSAKAVEELARLFADETDYLPGKSPSERRSLLEAISWRDYLSNYAEMGEEALTFLQKWSLGVWAIGADALPAWLAWANEYPGFAGMVLDYDVDVGEYDDNFFHFPDGNASVARLLVRHLVPGVAPGHTMEDVVAALFDYSKLDEPTNATRIRLSSTVVDLRHRDRDLTSDVEVTYVKDGEARKVTASRVIWAGYHSMLPHICRDVPAEQAAAQSNSVRAPLVYTSVLVRNWRSFANLGFWRAYCPGSFFQSVRVNRPVSMGDYHYPQSPDEPTVLHLQHIPVTPGASAADQFRAGRRALLGMTFEHFERKVRNQLDRMLRAGGFDAARDIAGITVNRWPHGYAFSVHGDTDEVVWWPEYWRHEQKPWIDARQPIGNIAIAGTDSSSNAMTESAIEEAHRAVGDLPGS